MANIELDGTNKKIKVDSGDLTLDVPGDIILDADGGDVVFADGGINILKVTNSSSDVVLQPQVDAKDIIFKQYDGTTVATVEDNGTFNVPTSKLAINGTAITSTAAELNILDGVTATATELNLIDGVTATTAELNLLDGGTSVGGSITLADADGIVTNDGGTMKTIPASDIKTYVADFECEEYDIWHLTTDFDGDATPIASNLARYATHFDKFGTGMSESSGVFTFPSTGKWLVSFRPQFYLSESGETDRYISGSIQLADGTNLTMGATSKTYISGGNTTTEIYMQTLIDVTNTSSITIRFCIDSTNSGVTVWGGGSANLNTNMQFFKLGAT